MSSPFNGGLRGSNDSMFDFDFDFEYLVAGDVVCSWGRGEDGQLGHGDAEDRPSPTQLSALDDHQIVSVTCGADHTVAYSQSRMEVYSWGWYASGFCI